MPKKQATSTPSNQTMSIAGMVAKGLTTEQFARKYGHLLKGIRENLTVQLEFKGCWDIHIHTTYTMHNNPDAYGFLFHFQCKEIDYLMLEGFTWKQRPRYEKGKDYWVWNVRKQVGI